MGRLLVGCDVGGTFTDAYVLEPGEDRASEAKASTTPDDPSQGAARSIERVLDAHGAAPAEVERVLHGTTTATNALLEDELAPTALVTNDGIEDVLEIRRQTRASLYDLTRTRPDPLVARTRRFGVQARLGPEGEELAPVDPDEVDALADQLASTDARAVAVCLLHAHVDAAHERTVAQRLRDRLDVPVVASHEVSPEFREVERFTTTVLNAALQPRMTRYLERLDQRLDEVGIQAPLQVLDSAGAVLDPAEAARLPVRTLLSGPAGGAAASGLLARETDAPTLLGVDMGGTSTDVSLVLEGELTQRWETEIGGHRIQIPAADVHTVGAGGGSIAWVDDAGSLRVGPASAGADPGPACYGRGGTEATVTDASLVLGRLPEDAVLGGSVQLDPGAARKALERVAEAADLALHEAARTMLEVATARAVRGIRVLTARHAVDPSEGTLAAFGGAGPMFGAEWAHAMGIPRVVLPAHAGVTSATGLLAAPPRTERSRTVLVRADRMDRASLDARFEALAQDALAALDREDARVDRLVSARYEGQSHELTVPWPPDQPVEALVDAFAQTHGAHHGYALEDAPVELVTLRVRAVAEPALDPRHREPPEDRGLGPVASHQDAAFQTDGEDAVEARVHTGSELEPGHQVQGPAIVRGAGSTGVVPPGWSGHVDGTGHLILQREGVP